MSVISINFFSRILLGVGLALAGGCIPSLEGYSAQYCPEGQHFDPSPAQKKCVDGFLDCTDCVQDNECGSKMCDPALKKCVPAFAGVMDAQMCLPPPAATTTTPGKKLGDTCMVIPNDPSCPANSMCGYDTSNNQNQYGVSQTICRARGLQLFHELGVCSVLFLNGAGSDSFTTTDAAVQLPNDRVLDIPAGATAVLISGCGTDVGKLFAFGYNSSNIAVKTPVRSAVNIATMSITINGGAPRTQGLLFQVSTL
jgi:hypothetical protein